MEKIPPLGVLREGLMEVVFGLRDRLYVVYPRYLSMRDVEFIYRTSERIVVAAVRQSGDTLEQMMQKAKEKTGQVNGEPVAEHAEFIRALGESMFLQKGRLTNFMLRERGRDLLEEGFCNGCLNRRTGESVLSKFRQNIQAFQPAP